MALYWVAFLVVGLALSSLLIITVGLGRKSVKHAKQNADRPSDRILRKQRG